MAPSEARKGLLNIMIKKTLLVATSLVVLLAAVGFVLYVGNPAPTVQPISAIDAAAPTKPYVVKVHAQWCPICMLTKPAWRRIEATYATRVNLVVLDVTNQATTDASRAEAKRLGLDAVFEDYRGATGTIVVVDGRTKTASAEFHGSRDFPEYRTAIDAALNETSGK